MNTHSKHGIVTFDNLENGYLSYTRKRKWACINGRYVQVPAKTSAPKVVRNTGKIKAGIGRQMDKFPA